MDVVIKLSDDQIQWCWGHARAIVELYDGHGSKGSGMYSHNKVGSNVVGVKGELVTALYLEEEVKNLNDSRVIRYYEDIKRSANHPGDVGLELSNKLCLPIEVKGLRYHQWDKFKRCIPPRQLKKYVNKNAIVVWTVADTQGDNKSEVIIKGWNYAKEVQEQGIYRKTICDNIWLEHDDAMHPPSTLLAALQFHNRKFSQII